MRIDWERDTEEALLAEFRESARKSADKVSFFALFKYYLKRLRDTAILDRFIVAAEAAVRENVRCPHCCGEYVFRYWTRLEGDDLAHAIELHCRPCGDFYTLAEDQDALSFFNGHVIRRVRTLERRAKDLRIEAGYVDMPIKSSLVWDSAREMPTLWINLNRVREASEVNLFWSRAKKEVRRRREFASRLR